MKSAAIIPLKKEIQFVLKILSVLVLSIGISLAVLFIFLNKDLESTYGSAFQAISDLLQDLNHYIVIAVLAQFLFSSILICLLGLLYTHKIAGPVFRLKMILKRFQAGEEPEVISFRKTDFLTGVAGSFNGFFVFLNARQKTIEEAEALLKQLDSRGGKGDREKLWRLEALLAELES
ncbi:MAG: hypothetical protein ACERK6_13110 [Candidatus Aminicenantaceae bacterium]